MSLKEEILRDIQDIQVEMDNPTFIWNGNSYPCIASITQIKRELEFGGFNFDNLLTMTIQRFYIDEEGFQSPVFPNDVIPQPQQKLTYQNLEYRIQAIKIGVTNANIRIIAVNTTKGI